MLELIISDTSPRRIERTSSDLQDIRRELYAKILRSKAPGARIILVTGHEAVIGELNALNVLAELPPAERNHLTKKYDIPPCAVISREAVAVNGAPLPAGGLAVPAMDAEIRRANALAGAAWMALDRLHPLRISYREEIMLNRLVLTGHDSLPLTTERQAYFANPEAPRSFSFSEADAFGKLCYYNDNKTCEIEGTALANLPHPAVPHGDAGDPDQPPEDRKANMYKLYIFKNGIFSESAEMWGSYPVEGDVITIGTQVGVVKHVQLGESICIDTYQWNH